MDRADRKAKVQMGYPDIRVFSYEHLPQWLQTISKPFCDLARHLWDNAPHHPETGVALRKLLEAKDAAVRSEVLLKEDLTERSAIKAGEIEDAVAGQPDIPPGID